MILFVTFAQAKLFPLMTVWSGLGQITFCEHPNPRRLTQELCIYSISLLPLTLGEESTPRTHGKKAG